MYYRTLILTCFLGLSSFYGMAQIRDVARIDYTSLPTVDKTSFERFRATLNAPIPLKKEGSYFFLGADYYKFGMVLKERTDFDVGAIRNLSKININVGYTANLKNDWRFGISVTPEFSTNEALKNISTSHVAMSGQLLFVKDNTENETVEKPYKLLLGLTYSSNSTLPYPLPLLSYYRKFNPKWSYSIGVPKSNLQYFFSEADRLKLFAQLDGFNAILSNEVNIAGDQVANRLNMTLILSGLQYEHYFTKHLQAYARAGYLWSQSIKLRGWKR